MAETYIDVSELPGGASFHIEKKYNTLLGRWEVHKTVSVEGDSLVRSEPRVLLDLDHDHIIELINAELVVGADGLATFSMPFIEGGSVEALAERGEALSVGDTIRAGVQLAGALSYIHNEVVLLHRDVRAANVLLSADHTRFLLTDFGSAARLDAVGRAGARGYALYYADGHAVRAGYFTAATDIYGLGITLFEGCSGALPFTDFDPEVVHDRVQRGARPLPDRCYDAFAPHIPQDLRRVLRKAMRRDPNSRHASAAVLARDLDALKCVDWRRGPGAGPDGQWEGVWPSSQNEEQGRRCRIETHTLEVGPNKGKVRAEARYWSDATGWRRIVQDETLDAGDAGAVSAFFDKVDARVAQVRAAR